MCGALCVAVNRAIDPAPTVELPAGAAVDGPAGAATHAARVTAQRATERPAKPALRAAAQDLRVDRHRHSQHDCDCGAREKMIDLHGRPPLEAAARPRPFAEYYDRPWRNLPRPGEFSSLLT